MSKLPLRGVKAQARCMDRGRGRPLNEDGHPNKGGRPGLYGQRSELQMMAGEGYDSGNKLRRSLRLDEIHLRSDYAPLALLSDPELKHPFVPIDEATNSCVPIHVDLLTPKGVRRLARFCCQSR